MEVRSRRGCEEGPERSYATCSGTPALAGSTPRIAPLDKKLIRKRAPRRQRMNLLEDQNDEGLHYSTPSLM